MVKHLIGVLLAVALVVDIAVFFGLGFGTGALSTTTLPPTGQAQYTVNQFNWGNSWGDGMSWAVAITNPAGTGIAPITSMLPGYQSTDLSFSLNIYSKGNCGNTGRPTFEPGAYASYGFYRIQYSIPGSGPVPFIGTLDGSAVSSNGQNALFVTANNTASNPISNPIPIQYCAQTTGGTDQYTSGNGVGTTNAGHTFSLSGIYQNGLLTVAFDGFATSCSGNNPNWNPRGGGSVCSDLSSASGSFGLTVLPPNGGRSFEASTTTLVLSAGASVSVLNQGVLFNGGTLQVGVTTGYDGPNGYQLVVLCPQARACGGQPDSAFPAQHVDNNIVGQRVFTWAIPSNYALRSNTPLINVITVALIANYGVGAQSLPDLVTISPLLNPGAPVISYTSSDGRLYPGVGASLTITVSASSTNRSGAITNITLSVFYLQPSQFVSSAPPCGNAWVTGCPFGQVISGKFSNNGEVGTYQFQVQPPAGAVAIGASAISYAGPGNGNISAPLYLLIRPANCVPGNPCDPTTSGTTLWSLAGPILMSVAIILAAALAFLYVPLPMLGRVLIIVLAVGLVVVFYVSGVYTSWFSMGGAH